MARLAGKVAAVTGAARGSGRSHCERMAEEGADIIALDVADAADDLRDLALVVQGHGRRCVSAHADVRSFEAVSAGVGRGVAELGPLDIVVANAGLHAAGAPTWEIAADDWQRTLDINVTGVWHTVKAAVPHLRPTGGSIVIVGSTSGLRGTANTAHYTANKHAVVGLMRTLANELGAQNVRVNTVHPGAVGTAMVLNEATFARLCPELENPTAADAAKVLAARNLLPVGWVDPVDVSNAVVFLASDEARYITATQLVVDAGLTEKA